MSKQVLVVYVRDDEVVCLDALDRVGTKMISIARPTSESCLVVICLHIIMQSLSTPYYTSIPSNVASTKRRPLFQPGT